MVRTRYILPLAGTLALVLAASPTVPTWGGDPSPPAGSFSPTGSLIDERVYHTATRLPDGRVLVIGGVSGDGEDSVILASTELFDPAAGAFSPAGSLIDARIFHTATLLPDGRVLLVGGWTMPEETETTGHTDLRFIPSAEIRDPASGTSVPTGSLVQVRFDHTATLLRDGRVLVLGGEGWDVTIASPELWDPVTGSFSSMGSPAELRIGHTATLLPDGRVLVVGGRGTADGEEVLLASAELWDPASRDFSPAGSLIEARRGHTATLLPDGRVLVVGGESYSASAELWDPVSGSFGPAGSLIEARMGYTATLLPDGRVLVIGGESGPGEAPLASAEVWDPATGAFGPAGSLCHARARHTATPLLDGRVLVIGGNIDFGAYTVLASAELWGPGSALSACPSASASATPQTSSPPGP